jgi:hypothetical protein
MFCPSCATENQPEQKYCRRCGQPLAGVHLALEGRVDEAIKTLRIGEKTPRVKFLLLAAALLLLSITTIHALRTGAPLAFLLMPACGLLLGLLIGLSKRAFKLWHVKRLLNARVEFRSLTANSVASPDFAIASNSSAAKPLVPVSVTENTTLELSSPQKGQK